MTYALRGRAAKIISRDVRRVTSANTASVTGRQVALVATHAAVVCATRRASRTGSSARQSTSPLKKQAQIEKEHLEAQLRQSQKMEAMGTLGRRHRP